ncbi:18372_t:CDS:1, partial [Gigaspora rosea]
QLSKTAKIINAKKADNAFENAFVTQHKSMYATKDHLTLLTKKAKVFLLRVFEDVYQKLGQSSIKNMKNNKFTFQLASLNFAVDKKQMLLGFSSDSFPSFNICDYCYEQFDGTSKGSMVIACSHGYHESCFINSLNKKCHYCEKFLNLGVDKNVSSLLTRLSKLGPKSNLVESLEADETNNLES